MDRRRFTQSALAAGLAAPMVLNAGPVHADRGIDAIARFGRLTFRPDETKTTLRPKQMLMWSPKLSVTLRLELRYEINQYPSRRIATGGATRPTVTQRVKGSKQFGKVYFRADALVLYPDLGRVLEPELTVFTHRELEWDTKKAFRPISGDIPFLSERLFKDEQVGWARQKNSELIILITPTIVPGYDD